MRGGRASRIYICWTRSTGCAGAAIHGRIGQALRWIEEIDCSQSAHFIEPDIARIHQPFIRNCIDQRAIHGWCHARQLGVFNRDRNWVQRVADGARRRWKTIRHGINKRHLASNFNDRHVAAVGIVGVGANSRDGCAAFADIGWTDILFERKTTDHAWLFLRHHRCAAKQDQKRADHQRQTREHDNNPRSSHDEWLLVLHVSKAILTSVSNGWRTP